MMNNFLKNEFVLNILDYLNCPSQRPTLQYLNKLISSYIRKVPWESVSRIVKRHQITTTRDCPRWPDEFWKDAMQYGFGGTCFESSLAFYFLLTSLGYEGYLTVNDMGESHGCHAAIVILINGKKYLVDNTIPIHSAVLINPEKTTIKQTQFANYTIRPIGESKYEIFRSHHPHRYAFTLIDFPVSLPDYQTIVENDYTESGHFLKSVVMVKAIGERTWRFFSDHQPYRIESFSRVGKQEIFVDQGNLPGKLAELFQMPQDRISEALSIINPVLDQSMSHTKEITSSLQRVAL